MKLSLRALMSVALISILGATGCGRVRARMAFRDGNKVYSQDKFREAVAFYSRATELDSGFAEAWFYLGSSEQGLYRPGKDTPDNLKHLENAISAYDECLKVDEGRTPNQKVVKENALGALTVIYSDDPKKDYEKARQYAEQLVKENPGSARNLFAMANLFEKFGKIDE